MRSPAQAIVWEICAKNRWSLIFAFGLIPLCALLSAIAGPGHELVNVVHAICVLMTFVSILWVCSYTANDSRGRFAGFPSWMYTLPFRTAALVFYPMLLGFLVTSVAVIAWEFTISSYWGAPVEPKYLGWHLLLFVGVLFSVQALVWSLHRFRWIRITALVAVIFLFLYVGLVGHVFKFSHGPVFWFSGVLLTLPLAFAGAVAGVERDRRGGWQGWTGKLLERLFDSIPRRSGPFASAVRAQFWIEWRRKGFFMGIVFFGVPMALAMLPFSLPEALGLDPVQTNFHFAWPFVLMIIMAGAVGGSHAKSDAWSSELVIHPFIATRPVTLSALVFAKMKSAAAVTGLGWLVFLILLPAMIAISNHMISWSEEVPRFWQNFPVNYPNFWRWMSNPVVLLAIVTVTWHTMVQTMAVALTGDKRHTVRSAWRGMIVLALVAVVALWLYKNRSWMDSFLRFLPWFTVTMVGLKAFGAIRSFSAAKALVSRRDFFLLLGLWSLTALLVLSAGIFATVSNSSMPLAILWLLVLWQFFPAGEIPQCVVALARNRHR